MTTLTNTFEGGSDETAITTANSGGGSGDAFNDVLNATFDTARSAHGSVACRWSVSGAASSQVSWLTSGTTWFARAYVHMTDAPPANMQLITAMDGGTIRLMVRVMTDRTVQITSSGFSSLGQSTTVLPLDSWVRVEARIQEGTGAGLCTVRIYSTDPDGTTPDETVTATSATVSTYERIRYGANFSGSQTYDLWGDDLGASDVDWLGPSVAATSAQPLRRPRLRHLLIR